MKRGTPRHPKVLELASRLGCSRATAVGLLECLWHFAGEFAQAGDVGRYGDDAIAAAVYWDGPSADLISAMVDSGWLDRCECHRLRVHDWRDHADQTVQRCLTNRSQHFLACYDDHSTVLARSQDETSLPLPLPLPLPSPLPEAASDQATRYPQEALSPWYRTPAEREAANREAIELSRDIGAQTGQDPSEVFRDAAHYPGAKTAKVNPAAMTPDRLSNTIADLRARARSLKKHMERADPDPEQVREIAELVARADLRRDVAKRNPRANGESVESWRARIDAQVEQAAAQ